MTTGQKVKEIIIEQLGVDVSEVKDLSLIEKDLGADSLDSIEIVMAIEEEFSIEIPDDITEKIKTPLDFINFIYFSNTVISERRSI